MNCPHCNQPISDEEIARHLASKGGHSKSEAKTAAARINGRKGGRPKTRREEAMKTMYAVVSPDSPNRGNVISRHRSREAAERKVERLSAAVARRTPSAMTYLMYRIVETSDRADRIRM